MDWKNIEFIFIDHSLEHISKHNVSLEEIEELLQNKLLYRQKHKEIKRYMLIGQTKGRILRLIVDYIEKGKYYLVTAYDAPTKDKKLYRKRVNK